MKCITCNALECVSFKKNTCSDKDKEKLRYKKIFGIYNSVAIKLTLKSKEVKK